MLNNLPGVQDDGVRRGMKKVEEIKDIAGTMLKLYYEGTLVGSG
jgi:hypothetical protein